MYEHVKTGCKHIPPSEQPLRFQPGYFLNKPRIFSSTCTIASIFIQIGYRNNFVIYPCTHCIYCLCNKFLEQKSSCPSTYTQPITIHTHTHTHTPKFKLSSHFAHRTQMELQSTSNLGLVCLPCF